MPERASAWARHHLKLLDGPTSKLVFQMIGTYADDKTGEAHPRQQTLADEAGVSIRTVKRTVARAVELGLMSVKHKGNQYSQTSYRLNLEVNVTKGGTFTPERRCQDEQVNVPPATSESAASDTIAKSEGATSRPLHGKVKVPTEASEGANSDIAIEEGISIVSNVSSSLGSDSSVVVHPNNTGYVAREKPEKSSSKPELAPPGSAAPPPWDHPPWFDPLTKLEGYRRIDHSRSAKTIKGVCFEASVDPSGLIRGEE